MADEREPPPMFGSDDEGDNDDLFKSAIDGEKSAPDGRESPEDLFADADPGTTEISLDDELKEPASAVDSAGAKSGGDVGRAAQIDMFQEEAPSLPKSSVVASADKTLEELEMSEEEGGDQFTLEINISDPEKVGDGMGAYMTYRVMTKTSIPTFRRPEFTVKRRFSDFLGLHEKLVETHTHQGKIVPPAPEKSVLGMTKIKMSKEEASSNEFVERRRASLERYVRSIGAHPVLRQDPDFVSFLETDAELPKASSTSALSGAGVMRLFSKVGDAMGKMTFKMDEVDQWFEEKQQHFENLDQQLRKLHASVESLVNHRRDLGTTTAHFAKSCAMLANSEEHTALSRALSQLADIEERIDQLHTEQAETDFFTLSELLKDYIALIGAVKETLYERVKCYKAWKDAEVMLTKKREIKAKLELAHKSDKIPQAQAEIQEWEHKVEKGQADFEEISETIKKEIARFEKRRVVEFKEAIVRSLEAMMDTQQKLIKYWESFLPEAKAIA